MAYPFIPYPYTHLPPPCGLSDRPPSFVIEKAKLMDMIKSESPIGELANLSKLLGIEYPKYTVHTIVDDIYSTCTVEFAEQEFTSSFLRTWKTLAMEDAAGLAIDCFLTNSSTFSHVDIPNLIPTISPILALENLCREKDWKVKYEYTGSGRDGWRCSVTLVKGETIVSLGEEGTFCTKRDAKRDAAAVMYDWQFE